MDLFGFTILAVSAISACVVFGLSIVGYGRIQFGAAAAGVVAFIASLALIDGARSNLMNGPTDTLQSVDQMFAESVRLLDLSQTANYITVCSAIVFFASATIRIWTKRSMLSAWYAGSA